MIPGAAKSLLSVLYVDDEPGLLEIGKLFLEDNEDVHVDTETSARAALTTLEKSTYDVIISDYQMPEMDGLAFLREVRVQFPDIPFILFTGRGREEVVIEAINNGADFYLQKGGEPTSQFSELAHKIRQAVRRRKAELALAESRDYLNLIFSSVKAGILVIDAATHLITDINPAASALIGLPREQIIGKECHRYVCPAEAGKCPITDLGQTVDNSEKILITAEGKNVPIIKYVTPVTISGKPSLLETFIDNTQRKQAEQELRKAYGELKRNQEEIQAAYAELAANEQILMHDYAALVESERSLRENEEKFRGVFNNANDAVYIHLQNENGPGKFLEVNDFACSLLGYSREELLKMSVVDILSPAHLREVPRISKTISEEGYFSFYAEFIRKDTSTFPVEVNTHVYRFSGREVVLAIARDMTERKRAEQSVALAGRKLHMMTEITRHEITNIITGLVGLVDMAYGMPAGEGRDQLNREIKGLALAIQKQMEFTREYEEIGVKEPRWQDVRRMIPSFSRPDIVTSPSLDALEIYADPLVAKIFTYLAENVIRHGGHATTIRIGTERHEPGLKIVFADNGVGVPKEMKTSIFERKIGEKKGMGLFLVREILAITGITISETGTPGEGARFEIQVPEGGFRYRKNGNAVPAEGEVPAGVPGRS
ncbi:PAS domain S-box protein [Methanoregula sp.]|uniref:hybrid sensor histidine kinase/response regulator n=1 Tax=Methanoregula sp. TaxID=2052170 RepID=UPI002BA3241C|nr:PAS domain S-box protein [Methanoregula sp.]HVP97114.1 PAS domain S-box protein [Methanoregula sp.]